MPTSTSPPPPPPKHGSGQFVGAVILMLLLMGGLIYWKVSGSEKAPPPPTETIASGPAEPTVDQIVPAPPPPPPPAATEDAGVSTTAKKATGTGIGTGCSTCGKCTGDPAPSFSAVLRARASQAQRCYEKALSQQEGLQGRLTVNLCVGVGGAVCGSSISNDSLGSPLVSQCVLNIYRATTFPSPKNGCVDAQVPLNFLPEKK